MIRSILWFRQDLRLHDNEALLEALRSSDELIPVYIFDLVQFAPLTRYGTPKTEMARTRFLIESTADLRTQLRKLGSDLIVRVGKPAHVLFELATVSKVHYIYCNRERTREEVVVQDKLEKKLWTIGSELRYSRGKMLYYTSDLPFPVTHCPDSYASFKKEVESSVPVHYPLDIPESLPAILSDIDPGELPDIATLLGEEVLHQDKYFTGGETAGQQALKQGMYLPESFMMEGTMLSPWMSAGCLSPKKVYYDAFH